MDVRPVGAGPTGTDLSRAAGPAAPTAKAVAAAGAGVGQPGAVIDAAAVAALSEPDLSRLLAVLERPLTPETSAQLSAALEAAFTAAVVGDVAQALDAVAQAAALHPLQAEALRSAPGLEPIRAQVDSLLTRLTQVARLDAEGRLSQATEAAQAAGIKTLAEWDARPEALILLAHRLLDSGGLANYVRAAEVAQVVIDGMRWAPSAAPVGSPDLATARIVGEDGPTRATRLPAFQQSWTAIRRRAPLRIRMAWRRAPLLVLLLAWLAVGVAGGVASVLMPRIWVEQAWPASLTTAGFELWALGFLGLVLFGFYMRIRNVRL
ncbi:MAG: hypothetical protein LAP40_20085 [Acidobacteriia bacterium]|nr:hypothetical protein [Terriglobia bacterium]